ncbi:MAG: hypothetical protein HS116_20700 [Planctomycetes bacterium]|nr:hypothetical protein [Planctomycetota bacterium]
MENPFATPQVKDDWSEALKTLELNLQTPLIPGEAANWAAKVQVACDELAMRMRALIHVQHREQFEEMISNDPQKVRQVEGLRDEDYHLVRQFAKLRTNAARLRQRAELAGGDEAPLKENLEDLIEEGLACIVAFRKQEVRIQNWFMESLSRDRGDVD